MKRYLKIFKQAEPAIFRIHGEQLDVFKEFLINFIKPEVLATNNRVSKLTQIDFNSSRNQLPKNLLSIGTIATKNIKKSRKDDEIVGDFLDNVLTAYSSCVSYTVKKLPLSNDFLKTVAGIDPVAILTKSTVTLKAIMHLRDIVTNVLSEQIENYKKECRKIMFDITLPQAIVVKKPVRADIWWAQLKDKYPLLSKISLAVLTIFHALRVESSFSVMGDVMDKKSGRMNVATYSSIQTIKYGLSAKVSNSKISKPKSVQLFQRSDRLKSPVMKEIVTEIRNSKKVYEDELKVSKEKSTKTYAKRVTKKKILETAFEVETSLKKKLIDTTSLVTNDKNTQQSSED